MAEAPKNRGKYRGFSNSPGYPKMRGQDGRRATRPLGSMKGGGKPPKKGGGLCVQIAPLAAFPGADVAWQRDCAKLHVAQTTCGLKA